MARKKSDPNPTDESELMEQTEENAVPDVTSESSMDEAAQEHTASADENNSFDSPEAVPEESVSTDAVPTAEGEYGDLLQELGESGTHPVDAPDTETRYDKGVTYTYKYDTAGNILSATDGTTTHTYTYGDANWRDLLTAVDGQAISYDQIGNPKNWYNGTTYSGLTWKNGRQLTSITTGGKTATYTYDADGIRTYKKVGNAEHEYRTLNGKVVYEKLGSGSTAKIMVFSYDAQGRPFAVKYSANNGGSYITYFYALNQQGDVVKIFRPLPSRDSNGNLIGLTEAVYATYTYDAWGNILSQSGSMAGVNPLRYRGYYYDSETGFYYLQSRYYDPANHRFINADAPEYSTMSAYGLNNSNLFAYCQNNPIAYGDENGEWLNFLIGAVVGAVVNAVSTIVDAVQEGGLSALGDGKTWAKVGVSAAVGAIEGAVAATPLGAVGQSLIGAATSGIENACHQAIDNGGFDKVDYGEVAFNAAIGAFSSRNNGVSKGTAAHLKTQERTLKNAAKPLQKRVKYYYSQTATLFYKPMVQKAKHEIFGSVKKIFVIGMVKSCSTQAQ